MQLDAWMPAYDFSERHATLVRAPAEVVYRAVQELDWSRLPLVRFLMALRALPALVVSPRATLRRTPRASEPARHPLLALAGSVLLCDDPPREIVIGLTGRFWRTSGGGAPTEVATFRGAPPPGHARVAMSFYLEPLPGGVTRLSTETRIRCADEASRRAFGWYWRVIRPGSGLIRRAMLRALKGAAEARA